MGRTVPTNILEEMNKAMAQLSATVGEDVPTLEEVRAKVEARYAKAKGMSELQGSTVEGRMRTILTQRADSGRRRTPVGVRRRSAVEAVSAVEAGQHSKK